MISNSKGQATNTYVYAADGRKLRVTNEALTMDYADNMIYENGSLKRILVDGGYIEDGAYRYYLTDHLGNGRIVSGYDGTVLQVNHYYPFGMAFGEGFDSADQPYKYNGKEIDTGRGLNWYDYGARFYGPALGRFHTLDPKATDYYFQSPYAYAAE